MMYKQIECPTCGNDTTAKSISEAQKCKWCRRLFKVKVTRRNKAGSKAKFDWEVESVDFPEDSKPKTRSIDDYYTKIYTVSQKDNRQGFKNDF